MLLQVEPITRRQPSHHVTALHKGREFTPTNVKLDVNQALHIEGCDLKTFLRALYPKYCTPPHLVSGLAGAQS